MLTLTDTASTVVKDLAERATGSVDAGLRISTLPDNPKDYEVKVAATPEPNDIVVVNDGAQVFLETRAAEALSDRVLDAKVEDDGAVRFQLGQQEA
jgi:Fe-S cluster assembly iron-binding protein IscA